MPDHDDRLLALAERFGLDVEGVRVSRRGVSFQLTQALRELTAPEAWRTVSWSLWCCRIVVDQVTSTYDVRTEREEKKARNVYEVASRYGERERYLIPSTVRQTAQTLADKAFEHQPWVDDRLDVVLGLQEGLGTHFLGEDELKLMPFDRENVWENARLAHFYASYKARPSETEKFDGIGRTKFFETVDGKTASRAILLPDFDWDASQDGGCCFLPSRDQMVIGEPFGSEKATEIDQRAAERAASIEAPDIPFFPTLYRLGPKTVVPTADAWEDRYPAPPDSLPVVRLA